MNKKKKTIKQKAKEYREQHSFFNPQLVFEKDKDYVYRVEREMIISFADNMGQAMKFEDIKDWFYETDYKKKISTISITFKHK